MSVRRSPQSKDSPTVGQGGSLSQPDLSRPGEYESDSSTSFRKRKQRECECNCNQTLISALQLFRTDMIAALETNLRPMREDIAAMKNQTNDIKITAEKLLSENSSIKADISELKESNSVMELKITKFEVEIEKLRKSPSLLPTSNIFDNEKLISEIQERAYRSKNVIIVGLPESSNADISIRRSEDVKSVENIFRNSLSASPKINNVLRLGRFFTGKVRPLKVCLENPQEVYELMKIKHNLSANVRMYRDQTPTERALLKQLNEELQRRKENGEPNLIIKYIKGTPKIVQAIAKN